MSPQNFNFDEGNGGGEFGGEKLQPDTTHRGGNIQHNIQERAKNIRRNAADKFDEATTRTGQRVESMGRTAHDKMTHAADRVAARTESLGAYLQDHDLEAMADDVAGVIRRYPVQSMLVGMGVGFMIGKMISR